MSTGSSTRGEAAGAPSPGTIRRVLVSAFGGPDRLWLVESPPAEPALGQVRVRTLAAGVSYPDLLIREGTYPAAPTPPFTPGYDLVGVVDRVGPGVAGWAVGDVVAAITVVGSYADAVCVPAEHVAPVPAGMDPAVAVCLAFNYITALQMLTRTVRVRPGARVLVHGAAGGIGTAALELGRVAGLNLYGTATGAGVEVVGNLGATAIDYRGEDFVRRVRELTGQGVDVVLDGIRDAVAVRSFRALGPGWRPGAVRALRDADRWTAQCPTDGDLLRRGGARPGGQPAAGRPAGAHLSERAHPGPASRLVSGRPGHAVPAARRRAPAPVDRRAPAAQPGPVGARAAGPGRRAGEDRPRSLRAACGATGPGSP